MKFPFEHALNCNTKEVYVLCNSSITAMGLPHIVNKFYPDYKVKIVDKETLQQLKNQLAN